MTGYVLESFHDLLAGESEAISDSGSSGGSHHPSRECFMAGVPEERVEDAHSWETPPSGPNNRDRERNQTPPPTRLEQLRERQKELVEVHLQINRSTPNSSKRLDAAGTKGARVRRRLRCKPEDPQRRRGPPALRLGKQEHHRCGSFVGWAPGASNAQGAPRSPKVAHTHRARGTTTGRELDVLATWAKCGLAPPREAGYQGRVRPSSPMRGRRSHERPPFGDASAPTATHTTPSTPGGTGTRTSKRWQAKGYHPSRGGRCDSSKDRSPSSDPPGPRVFCARICCAVFPQWYRPPANITRYARETNPSLWLEDYRLACWGGGGVDDDFIIRNLPLSLADSTGTWLEHPPADRIHSWSDLREIFEGNFRGTYERPGNPRISRNASRSRGKLFASTSGASARSATCCPTSLPLM
jgi:hypothetical protein